MKKRTQTEFRIIAKTALLKKGMSISALATKLGRPRSSVSKSINNSRFPKLNKLIATELGL